MTSPAATDTPVPLTRQAFPGLAGEIERYLQCHLGDVEQMIRSGGDACGVLAGQRLAKVYDGMLSFLLATVRAMTVKAHSWVPMSLAVVGSYGRGALSYRSDLDIRLLCEGDPRAAEPIAEALLYPMWDARLAVGHQVVDADQVVELAHTDLPTATSILDWRSLTEHEGPAQVMLTRVFEGVFGVGTIAAFLERIDARAEERHQRYGGSVYLLEPDVKNGPGGLRDFDVAFWAARARWRVVEFKDLVRAGLMVPRELHQIESAVERLWRIRNLLHLFSGRRSDRLGFDRQEQIAEALGYGKGRASVEQFMSDYYRAARTLTQAREMVVQRCLPLPLRRPHEVILGNGLKLTSGAVSLVHPAALQANPALALRLFAEALRRDIPVYGFTRDVVTRATTSTAFCQALRASDEASQLFVQLCTVSRNTRLKRGSVLKELHDVGLLVAMIPEFAPVVGRVHHDIYHTYTVDVHSVAAVDQLAALCRGELAAEFPLASRVAAEIARPTVLFLATLLHDIGKDVIGGHHWVRGHDLARGILARLGVDEADIIEIEHLILKHLRMYHVATRRDIDDPRALEEFCKEMRGTEGLRDLYLLTVADVSTTSPGAMTSWKARMLDELYVAADRRMGGEAEARDRRRTSAIRARVHDLWGEEAGTEFLAHFLAAMPERYLYANDPPGIVVHARLAAEAQGSCVKVRILSGQEEYSEVAIVADDRPGLLAMLTAALAAARLNVMGAQIYSWQRADGVVRALDVFWVSGGRHPEGADALIARMERDVCRMLRGEIQPSELVGPRSGRARLGDRPMPSVPTRINIDNRAATDHTVLEITTRDRNGLLFGLSNAIVEEGLTISLAKINTEGERVADVFYVTEPGGSKLTSAERVERLKARIQTTIEKLESGV